MPIIDDRTGNRDYKKPAGANRLEDDVTRIRQAIDAIDADIQALLDRRGALNGVASLVDGKVPSSQMPNTDGIAEGASHLYYTDARARAALQAATATLLGGIKVGSGFSIAPDGTLSTIGSGSGEGLPAFNELVMVPSTTGQTAFAPSGGYVAGTIELFLNGVLLIGNGEDYTASNGTSITLTAGINTDDRLLLRRWTTADSLPFSAITDKPTTLAGYGITDAALASEVVFAKADTSSVVFTKTGAATLSIKAGTYIAVGGSVVHFASATAITMPAHAAGTDYAVWVKDDGSIEATSNHTTPPAAGNWRKIGGYHYGLVAPATTVAGGGFATTGAGMIWTQPDVDKIAGINTYSLWDLRWRPATADPRGMTLVDGGTWVDIYLCGSDHITNGTSKYNSDIASGTVLPRKPLEFGGNGTTKYSSLNWWEACEIVRSHGKRLPWNQEFVAAAYGVTEGIAIGGASSTYPNTMRNAGYTSKYGLEQATGHQWVWGLDSGYRPDGSVSPWAWRDVTGGRGQMYLYTELANVRALFGGARDSAGFAGSRASNWNPSPWNSAWTFGLRAACDHLSL